MNSCAGSAKFCQNGLTGPGGASFTSISAGNANVQISIVGGVASISSTLQALTPAGTVAVSGVVSQTAAHGVVAIDPMWSTLERRTYLDAFIDPSITSVHVPIPIATFLSAATVILPLRTQDRSVSGSDVLSRNLGTLGGNAILGTTTNAMRQCAYAMGKGVRGLVRGGAECLQLPAAWIDPDAAFTLVMRFQRPCLPAGGATYANHVHLGDIGGAFGSCRYYARQNANVHSQTQFNSGTNYDVSTERYNPTILTIVSTAGGPGTGQYLSYLDGVLINTTAKTAGALSGRNHLLGGGYTVQAPYAYELTSVLDVLVFPSAHDATSVATGVAALQCQNTVHLDVLTGQSNMVGGGNISEVNTTAAPNQLVAYNDLMSTWDRGFGPCDARPATYGGTPTYFGPELTLMQARPGKAAIKFGNGGTASTAWFNLAVSGITLALVDAVLGALWQLSSKIVVDNFVFLQGETDGEIGGLVAATRQGYLASIAAQWRRGFASPTMRVVVGRLNIDCQNVPQCVSYAAVRAGDALFAGPAGNPGVGGGSDAYAVLVDLDAVHLTTNDYHYPSSGHLAIGTLLAAGMQ